MAGMARVSPTVSAVSAQTSLPKHAPCEIWPSPSPTLCEGRRYWPQPMLPQPAQKKLRCRSNKTSSPSKPPTRPRPGTRARRQRTRHPGSQQITRVERKSMELSMMRLRLQRNSTGRAELKQFQRCTQRLYLRRVGHGLDRIVAEMAQSIN
ncbi:hypothetical protein B0T11DRAFT_273824 [Plectosphaerella cucumerina]|uniref:Uncharacterized protein n=1 Tax=Plectosphaerella cucumerina TaxID=40658 RepID=A0A8K0TUR2_9PEZI|nr:hypothetical protein B0T11DRAFT_273824 [Plectosphaerella cucumerina]